jgi:Tol biopolymer transport system component
VDRRADIWAFGVVLLEMLTGKQLFTGDTAAETLASVIKEPIAIDRLPASTPPAVRQLIARCLERDVRRRLQHIGEARIALEGPFQIAPETKAAAPKRVVRAVAAGGALLLLALAALGWLHLRESSPHLPTIRFQVQLPEKWAAASFQISPDGRYLAMTNSDAVLQHSRLWIRPLDGLEATALSGTEGASYPFWSPDSASLAFFAGGKLKRIAVSGGPPQIICDAPGSRGGGTWGRDGTILFVATLNHFSLVTAAGGAPADVPAAIAGEQRRFPRFLPDGRHFLYVRTASGPSGDGVYVASLDAGAPIRLLPGTASAWFVPADAAPSGGYLLFRQQGALMAQAFDVKRFKLSGPAIPVADRVGAEFTYRNTSYSASDTGVLVYTALIEGNKELVWLDRSGKQIQTAGPTGVYNNFRLSPDGVNVAFDRSETEIGSSDIWALDTRRQIASRLTSDPAVENLPIWSPDGLRLVFPSNRSGTFDLYSKAATGTGQEELVIKLGTPTGWGTDWSRDGRFILYQMPGETTGQDLWVAPQFGDRKPYPYLHTQFNEQDGKFSPDGRWIAYVSDESGRDEIYVQSFPLSGEKRRISAAGGIVPSWRKDGAELFYLGSDRNLVAVPIQIGKTVNAGVPKALFPLPESARRNSYAASDDGQRFLVARSVGDDPPLTVVVNWQAALKK